ncbi:hypothetical protein [Mycoplasmopsis bovis]|uniref:hypothetical protein n=1 Tax=Mycoplasmopsis bovis TaxID=28903 RepID=UPI001E4520F8|nr:hypothetical protein [Mycoplasmopsis bovis]
MEKNSQDLNTKLMEKYNEYEALYSKVTQAKNDLEIINKDMLIENLEKQVTELKNKIKTVA